MNIEKPTEARVTFSEEERQAAKTLLECFKTLYAEDKLLDVRDYNYPTSHIGDGYTPQDLCIMYLLLANIAKTKIGGQTPYYDFYLRKGPWLGREENKNGH